MVHIVSLFCVFSGSQGGIWEGVVSHMVVLQLLEVECTPQLRLEACPSMVQHAAAARTFWGDCRRLVVYRRQWGRPA